MKTADIWIKENLHFRYNPSSTNEAGQLTCLLCGKTYQFQEWRTGMKITCNNMAKHVINKHKLNFHKHQHQNIRTLKKAIHQHIEEIDNS